MAILNLHTLNIFYKNKQKKKNLNLFYQVFSLFFLFDQTIKNHFQKKKKKKKVILEFLEGKRLIACETAIRKWSEIANIIGGEREKQRIPGLLKKIQVVPDSPSEKANLLASSKNISQTNKIIFGTGDFYKAITITSNISFIRSCLSKNVTFSYFPHSPRALSENG